MRPFSKNLVLMLYYRLPVIALCLVIYWQSSYPSFISEPLLFLHEDKVLHFAAYACLAVLSARCLKMEKPFWSPLKIMIITLVFSSAYGLSDEIHQAFVPSRTASGLDFLADLSGSIFGCLFYLNFLFSRK